MGNRRLYNEKSFLVESVVDFHDGKVWHLVGIFTKGSVKTQRPKKYRIRVKPDSRWYGVSRISFHVDHVYESESMGVVTRRHMYGSGKWYISPYRAPGDKWWDLPGIFTFEELDVEMSSGLAP